MTNQIHDDKNEKDYWEYGLNELALVERYADNGEFNHYELIDLDTGKIVWPKTPEYKQPAGDSYMSKANEPAYPMYNELGNLYSEGLSKREKLAMEIYARIIQEAPETGRNEKLVEAAAKVSLRAADIFFEQLNK